MVQPRLKLGATREARTSFPLAIKTGDMELPDFVKLFNTAYFVVVSKDRMRFHVTLQHKWKSMSDPSRWMVWIEDDQGNRYYPETLDRKRVKPVNQVYGQTYYRGRSFSGQPTEYAETLDEVKDGLPLLDVSFYRGDGDYVFYRRDIFRKDMKRLTLVLKRPGYEYRYVWHFVRDPDEEPAGELTAQKLVRPR